MKHFLIVSDLSDRSKVAIARGVELADALGAKVTIFHVVDSALPSDLAEKVKGDAEDSLDATVSECVGQRDVETSILVEIGDVVTRIEETAQATDADLLIVGTHRRRAFLDEFRETTVESLLRCSRIPVLVAISSAEKPYQELLSAVALSRNCAKAIQIGLQIAPNARIQAFHVHEVSFEKEATLDYGDWHARSSLPEGLSQPTLMTGPVGEALEDIKTQKGCDLLTIGAHTRLNAAPYFIGGVTASLIRKPPCDLLIAK